MKRDRATMEARKGRVNTGSMSGRRRPVVRRCRELQADLVLENVRRRIDLHVQGPPQGDSLGRAVGNSRAVTRSDASARHPDLPAARDGEPLSGGLGERGRLHGSTAEPPGESMAESHGDDADEQMGRLDDPVAGIRQQAHLRDAEGRNDQAPDQDEESKRPAARCQETDDGEDQETDDEEATEQHVERQQRERMTRPEDDAEHHECDAEDTDECACGQNEVLHSGSHRAKAAQGDTAR